MKFSFAQFLLNSTNIYNGHIQTETKGIPVEQGLVICKDLEELTDHKYSFTLELWTDGSYTIHQMDYWKKGEHILGDVNRMICGVSNT